MIDKVKIMISPYVHKYFSLRTIIVYALLMMFIPILILFEIILFGMINNLNQSMNSIKKNYVLNQVYSSLCYSAQQGIVDSEKSYFLSSKLFLINSKNSNINDSIYRVVKSGSFRILIDFDKKEMTWIPKYGAPTIEYLGCTFSQRPLLYSLPRLDQLAIFLKGVNGNSNFPLIYKIKLMGEAFWIASYRSGDIISSSAISEKYVNDIISESQYHISNGERLFNTNFIFLVILILLINIIVVIIFIDKYIKNPISYFFGKSKEIAEGNYGITCFQDSSQDVVHISNFLNSVAGLMRESKLQLEQSIEDKLNAEKNFDLAGQVQQLFMPNLEVFSNDNRFEVFAEGYPSKNISGDFFDVIHLPNGNIALIMADVSGKSLSAAFYMSVANGILRDACIKNPDDPSIAINLANKLLFNYNIDMFVTTLLAYYNPNTGDILYVNAGHNESLISRDDGSYSLFGLQGNVVLGVFDNSKFISGREKLEVGDILMLFTDGVNEATSPEFELYGNDRIVNFLLLEQRNPSLKSIVCDLISSIRNFESGAQFDDITILLLRRMR